MLKAIEDGRAQAEIAQSAYAYQQQVETRERTVVGVNRFGGQSDPEIELHRPRPEIVEAQIAGLAALRRERDDAAVQRALTALADEARGGGNLMYPIQEAVRAYATIGEICTVLRQEFGEYRAASF